LFARSFDEKRQPAVQRRSRERLFSKLLLYTVSLFESLANFIHDTDSFMIPIHSQMGHLQVRYRTDARQSARYPCAVALFRREVILDGDRN
jgi:hypothetical protein